MGLPQRVHLLVQKTDGPVHNSVNALAIDSAHRDGSAVLGPSILNAARMRLVALGDAVEILLELSEVSLGFW